LGLWDFHLSPNAPTTSYGPLPPSQFFLWLNLTFGQEPFSSLLLCSLHWCLNSSSSKGQFHLPPGSFGPPLLPKANSLEHVFASRLGGFPFPFQYLSYGLIPGWGCILSGPPPPHLLIPTLSQSGKLKKQIGFGTFFSPGTHCFSVPLLPFPPPSQPFPPREEL